MDEKGVPETSDWATKYTCGARGAATEIVDAKAGYVYDSTRLNQMRRAGACCRRPARRRSSLPGLQGRQRRCRRRAPREGAHRGARAEGHRGAGQADALGEGRQAAAGAGRAPERSGEVRHGRTGLARRRCFSVDAALSLALLLALGSASGSLAHAAEKPGSTAGESNRTSRQANAFLDRLLGFWEGGASSRGRSSATSSLPIAPSTARSS